MVFYDHSGRSMRLNGRRSGEPAAGNAENALQANGIRLKPSLGRGRLALVVVLVHGLVLSQVKAQDSSLISGPGYEGAIMPAEALRRSEPADRRSLTQFRTPTEVDVRQAEGLLVEYLASAEVAVAVRGSRIRSELAHYKRQYWGLVRAGQREILISFFHTNTPVVSRGLWWTTVVAVQGGGDQYFRVSYGVESKRFSRLQVNAPE